MSVRFCTTCGRTYSDETIDMCPHDGTPLFDMAGESNDDEAGLDVSPSFASEPGASDPETIAIPEADAVAAAQDAALGAVSEPIAAPSVPDAFDEPGGFDGGFDSGFDSGFDGGFDDDLPPVTSEPLAVFDDEPSEPAPSFSSADDLFDEPVEDDIPAPIGFDDDAFGFGDDDLPAPEPIGFDDDMPGILPADAAVGDYEVDLPEADEASSLQIAAGIESTLDELTGTDDSLFDDPIDEVASTSLADSFNPDIETEVEPELPPIEPEPASGGSKAPLLVGLLLVLIIAGGAGWYFTMGPGAQKPTPPTPKVTPKTTPKTDTKTDPKADTKTDPKADPKSDPKTDTKTDGKTDTKTDDKTDAKTNGQTDGKTDSKADSKADDKTGGKTDTKTDSKTDSKTDDKTGAKTTKKAPVKKPVKKDPVKKPVKKDPVKKPVKKDPPKKDPPKKDPKPETKPEDKKKLNNELDKLMN